MVHNAEAKTSLTPGWPWHTTLLVSFIQVGTPSRAPCATRLCPAVFWAL